MEQVMKTLKEKRTIVGTVFIASAVPHIAPSAYSHTEHAIHDVISSWADAMNTVPTAGSSPSTGDEGLRRMR
jgi:3-dehydroquinate dehydratase